ncbi:MAG TPA: acyl-CoA dehydrogenase family protein, partial [Steroidobacter sp.]|nr:acyl-CoA dehydrogenase family protein [Steroidobacter sp.]
MSELESFRAEVRAWLERNCPISMRTPLPSNEVVWGGRHEKFVNPEARLWLERMVERGWTVPRWPKQYSGAGLDAAHEQVLSEELKRIDARPPLIAFPLWMLGPALLEFANEEQKQFHLPRIARGEIRWCQGYSEPGAGSDLAAVQTRAEDRGDHYLVNGSKIWTSYADKSDWMFCLVRTDPSVRKQEGIGFLLIDMQSPGISVAPIRLISGASPFCQVFLADVKVPKNQLVGRPNQGWSIAKRLLEYERKWFSELDQSRIGHIVGVGGANVALPALAKEYLGERAGRIADESIRAELIAHDIDEMALQATLLRVDEQARASGVDDGRMASVFKYYGAKLYKERHELMMSIMGTRAL